MQRGQDWSDVLIRSVLVSSLAANAYNSTDSQVQLSRTGILQG